MDGAQVEVFQPGQNVIKEFCHEVNQRIACRRNLHQNVREMSQKENDGTGHKSDDEGKPRRQGHGHGQEHHRLASAHDEPRKGPDYILKPDHRSNRKVERRFTCCFRPGCP